ncbi:hypothetical protein HK097_007683 [Rhizophlyctis rosea]|uniref:Uncharacterized protein n=1 Tax=Rhizophlyctis rosea TaxID=64517 RepID=A0AAD5X1H2_9FUNG|nr:hypothetical protein HK097_007683 [Rhizophlyctis rosea]
MIKYKRGTYGPEVGVAATEATVQPALSQDDGPDCIIVSPSPTFNIRKLYIPEALLYSTKDPNETNPDRPTTHIYNL